MINAADVVAIGLGHRISVGDRVEEGEAESDRCRAQSVQAMKSGYEDSAR
jgi:hypothetical protein